MGYITLNLSKDYLERTKEKAAERALKEFGEEAKDELYYPSLDAKFDELGIDGNGRVSISADTEVGYISVELQPTATDLLPLIELSVKRLNRFKTVLESLK